jgi:hypothetical protein
VVGIDFSKPDEYERFRKDPNIRKEKCERFVQYVVEKLYELEDE